MNPINLVEFAEHSQKVPVQMLVPGAKKSEHKLWKVFLGHYIDFAAGFVTTTMMVSIFNLSLKSFLVTKGLQKAWSDSVVMSFTISVLPAMIFSYFFFSYFLNHGQTWGMHLMKKRISMREQSFKDAALWACSSMVLCFSCGLSYFLTKDKWKSVKSHDYLYDHLMVDRPVSPVHLVSAIEEYNKEEVVEEEYWSNAA